MPFIKKGNAVYKKVGGKLIKKGSSKSASMAARYMKALYAHTNDSMMSKNKMMMK